MHAATFRFFLLATWTLLTPVSLLGDAKGAIDGNVLNSFGSALSGVKVIAKGNQTYATKTEVSGYFSMQVDEGSYLVLFALQGYLEEQRLVKVELGKTATLSNVVLKSSQIEDAITVTGAQPPVVEISSTGANINTEAIERLPMEDEVVPSATTAISSSTATELTDGSTRITIAGASGQETRFLIDGVQTGTLDDPGQSIGATFLDEFDVFTGRLNAEHGSGSGALVSVMTKSGSEEFEGSVTAIVAPRDVRVDPRPLPARTGFINESGSSQFGVTLSGPILSETLTFFAGAELDKTQRLWALHDQPTRAKDNGRLLRGQGKVFVQPSPHHSLSFSYLGDSLRSTGAALNLGRTLNGLAETYTGVRTSNHDLLSARYGRISEPFWFFSGALSIQNGEADTGPANGAADAVQVRTTRDDFFQTGGFGFIRQTFSNRSYLDASATFIRNRLETKVGVQYQEREFRELRDISGGQIIDKLQLPSGRLIYAHEFLGDPSDPDRRSESTVFIEDSALFAQTEWDGFGFSLNAGVRWERPAAENRQLETELRFKDEFAPRLGFSWSSGRFANLNISGYFGRFFDELRPELLSRATHSRSVTFNYDSVDTRPNSEASAEIGTDPIFIGGRLAQEADIQARRTDDAGIVVEKRFGNGFTGGLRLMHRDSSVFLEDFVCGQDGTYCVGNPGLASMKSLFTLGFAERVPIGSVQRTFWGFEATGTMNFHRKSQLSGSYMFSRKKGHENEPTFLRDPYDSFDFFDYLTDGQDLERVTIQGPSSDDRTHQMRFSGLVFVGENLSIGTVLSWKTGTPTTRYGYSSSLRDYIFVLDRRGSTGRTPDVYEADLSIQYPFVYRGLTLTTTLDAFNVLNQQGVQAIDERWAFTEAENSREKPSNPRFGSPTQRMSPAYFGLRLKLSF